jgi:hypothetical protein
MNVRAYDALFVWIFVPLPTRGALFPRISSYCPSSILSLLRPPVVAVVTSLLVCLVFTLLDYFLFLFPLLLFYIFRSSFLIGQSNISQSHEFARFVLSNKINSSEFPEP